MAHLDHSIVFHLGGDPDEAPPTIGSTDQVAPAAPGTPADADLGIDLDVLTDLDPGFRLAFGRRNLGNALGRRYATPRGYLRDGHGGDPEYGEDVVGKMNSGFTAQQSAALVSNMRNQALLDGRVAGAAVRGGVELATSNLPLDVDVEIAEGPYEKIKPVAELTIEDLIVRE